METSQAASLLFFRGGSNIFVHSLLKLPSHVSMEGIPAAEAITFYHYHQILVLVTFARAYSITCCTEAVEKSLIN